MQYAVNYMNNQINFGNKYVNYQMIKLITMFSSLLFLALNIYSEDTLKWNFKYSGYANTKTIKLPKGVR